MTGLSSLCSASASLPPRPDRSKSSCQAQVQLYGKSPLAELNRHAHCAQADAAKGVDGSRGMRCVPDGAMVGDPHSGYSIICAGQQMVVGGTSAVAPMWAAWKSLTDAVAGKRLPFSAEVGCGLILLPFVALLCIDASHNNKQALACLSGCHPLYNAEGNLPLSMSYSYRYKVDYNSPEMPSARWVPAIRPRAQAAPT